MKTMKNILMASLLAFFIGTFAYEAKAQHVNVQFSANVSFRVFYRALAPYGVWFNYGHYGMCWKPSVVNRSWQPYRNGQWVWTNYGWTWMSNYSWGWAPFHYGRWIIDSYHGWIWVPDYEWAPAWVQWRYSNDYIGWAPLPPGIYFDVNYGIGYDNRDYGVDYTYWSYINSRDFNSRNYIFISGNRIRLVHQQTRNVTNITVTGRDIHNYGPRVADIERVTRSKVSQYNIVNDNRSGSGNNQRIVGDKMYIYRPTDIERPIGSTRGNTQTNRSEQTIEQTEQGRASQTIDRTTETNATHRSEADDNRTNLNGRTTNVQNNNAINRTETETETNRTGSGTNRTGTETIRSNESRNSERTTSIPNRSEQNSRSNESTNRNNNNNTTPRSR